MADFAPFGWCECAHEGCVCKDAETVRAAVVLVTRDSRNIRVCSRCYLRLEGDQIVGLFRCTPEQHKQFFEMDALGMFALEAGVLLSEWGYIDPPPLN